MINNYFKSFTLLLSLFIFFSIIPLNSVEAAEITSGTTCGNSSFYGSDAYATVQTTKIGTTSDRVVAWGLQIKKANQSKYGKEVRVSLASSRVNYLGINPPYQPHYGAPSYNFHGSLKNYQFVGQSGGGTLKPGDKVFLSFKLKATGAGSGADTVTIDCVVD